jgi:antitoxin (DNA-binding transcriptional repressor) of toxin-antitoxin stability system
VIRDAGKEHAGEFRGSPRQLSQLVQAVLDAQSVTILRNGKPAVDLIRTRAGKRKAPKFGTMKGRILIKDPNWHQGPRPTRNLHRGSKESLSNCIECFSTPMPSWPSGWSVWRIRITITEDQLQTNSARSAKHVLSSSYVGASLTRRWRRHGRGQLWN